MHAFFQRLASAKRGAQAHFARDAMQQTGAARALYRIVCALSPLLLGAAVGLIALWVAANALSTVDAPALYSSYLAIPQVVILNLLPPVLLAYLGYFLFSRFYAALLCSALPVLVYSFANYFKIRLRNDPAVASDISLLRTAGGVAGNYSLELSKCLLAALALTLGLFFFALMLLPRRRLRARWRVLGAAVCLALGISLYQGYYTSDTLYYKVQNYEQLDPWSEVEDYLAHGGVYPFLYSIRTSIPSAPSGYNEENARALLASCEDADIPENEKITVMGVMCEALTDLSELAPLSERSDVAEIYAPLHALEERSLSGHLLTNIFSGGTVNTEWCALTGYSTYETFTAPTDSYVWYFDAQGYDTAYQHPGFSWFYDRANVNAYLGFDQSRFTEDYYGALVEPVAALFHSDGILFDTLLDQLDERSETDAPLFSFSVTYQNHGPYNTETIGREVLSGNTDGWSSETYAILNNYLYGVGETVTELSRLADELEARDTPVVLFAFGDHKPWLGDDKSAYMELGVDLEISSLEGFYNYYTTPYLIFANSAAKELLGSDFTGDGGDFSPCYLMAKVFDACGWEGPGFMQLSREMRAVTPLLSVRNLFLQNGTLTRLMNEQDTNFYRSYLGAQYYREHSGK